MQFQLSSSAVGYSDLRDQVLAKYRRVLWPYVLRAFQNSLEIRHFYLMLGSEVLSEINNQNFFSPYRSWIEYLGAMREWENENRRVILCAHFPTCFLCLTFYFLIFFIRLISFSHLYIHFLLLVPVFALPDFVFYFVRFFLNIFFHNFMFPL